MKNITSISLFIILSFLFNNIHSQDIKENWLPFKTKYKDKVYINTANIITSKNDFYVWVLEENDPPIKIEFIDRDIYKTKTYFLINKELKRYRILQIIFYDKNNNVIKSYSYDDEMQNENLKYSCPIFEGSNIECVLLKCIELTAQKK